MKSRKLYTENMLTKNDLGEIQKLLKPLKEDIVEVRKDQKLIIRFFDREYLDLRKRVETIETYLKMTSEINYI